jgi:membrane protease subunit HflC
MNKTLKTLLILFGVGLIILAQSVFMVDQRQQAIVLQFGDPVGDVNPPGLHFKIPVIQTVRYFDRRILSVDPDPDQVVIASDAVSRVTGANGGDTIRDVTGEPIILDTFARYKIVDPLQFMKTLRTVLGANSRLENILQNATRAALGKTTLKQLLSPARTKVMEEIAQRVNETVTSAQFGIEIVDVRIVRADLTSELLLSTVTRMKSELQKRATETRAKGEEVGLEIRSKAEKERTVILANANRDSEILKGAGDKTAIKIYTDAFNKDKDFYSFLRSLEAYRNTLANEDTRLILSPDSAFFKHFKE